MNDDLAVRIAELNDGFRKAGPLAGGWVLTRGVEAMGPQFVLAAVSQVQRFDSFTEDNDPYREHDCGAFELMGEHLFWKIDCYDPDLAHGSNDPGDPVVTRRILTILLASEY